MEGGRSRKGGLPRVFDVSEIVRENLDITLRKESTSDKTDCKNTGRVYTPRRVVDQILDLAGYRGPGIVGKRVVDNSCGDGAFLGAIVERYCRESRGNLKRELEEFVFGIEIDERAIARCAERLDEMAARFGARDVRWNLLRANALSVEQYDGTMDFVLGNPPYVRVHRLGDSFDAVKRFKFGRRGMTDLYLVFYEIGLNMLSENGTLAYIAPSSFFNSVAGEAFRTRIVEDNLLASVVDLGHYQAFKAATYNAIVVLQKNRAASTTKYYEYDGEPRRVDELALEDLYFQNAFHFLNREDLRELKEILTLGVGDKFEVKNGFATLADSFFIGDSVPLSRSIPVVKASTGKWTRCVFPYENGKLVPWEELARDAELRVFYGSAKQRLKKRSITNRDEWYGFGRSQGIVDVPKRKFSINSLLRDEKDLKLVDCPPGPGVYGGLYVVSDVPFDEWRNALVSERFARYVASLKKYKSGGYYTFSSKDLKTFLEYSFR